jgi:hypothetical protein
MRNLQVFFLLCGLVFYSIISHAEEPIKQTPAATESPQPIPVEDLLFSTEPKQQNTTITSQRNNASRSRYRRVFKFKRLETNRYFFDNRTNVLLRAARSFTSNPNSWKTRQTLTLFNAHTDKPIYNARTLINGIAIAQDKQPIETAIKNTPTSPEDLKNKEKKNQLKDQTVMNALRIRAAYLEKEISEGSTKPNKNKSMKEALLAGETVRVKLNTEKYLGTLQPNGEYDVIYKNGTFSVTGFNLGSNTVGTWDYSNANINNNKLSLWGGVFGFDGAGNLSRGEEKIGEFMGSSLNNDSETYNALLKEKIDLDHMATQIKDKQSNPDSAAAKLTNVFRDTLYDELTGQYSAKTDKIVLPGGLIGNITTIKLKTEDGNERTVLSKITDKNGNLIQISTMDSEGKETFSKISTNGIKIESLPYAIREKNNFISAKLEEQAKGVKELTDKQQKHFNLSPYLSEEVKMRFISDDQTQCSYYLSLDSDGTTFPDLRMIAQETGCENKASAPLCVGEIICNPKLESIDGSEASAYFDLSVACQSPADGKCPDAKACARLTKTHASKDFKVTATPEAKKDDASASRGD